MILTLDHGNASPMHAFRLTVSAPVVATSGYPRYEPTAIPEAALKALDGLEHEESMLIYLVDHPEVRDKLRGVSVQGGHMALRQREGQLRIQTEFRSDAALTLEQVAALQDYMRGQYSDGGGSGWLQQFNDAFELLFEVDFVATLAEVE